MSNTTSTSLDAKTASKAYPYAPELQTKFEDLTQEIDALLHELKQEQSKSFGDDREPVMGWNPSLSPAPAH
jgi:hypothetical protein